ncbi:MAG: DUF4918 family protein [Ignavibacteriales bacterium]|nr:DUF4918 family protein [Ignavibacteriales bacterium]
MKTFADNILAYFSTIQSPEKLPGDIEPLMPFNTPEVKHIMQMFYRKYFEDNNKRHFIFGINPGRFGGGITGIPFTDPVQLEKHCALKNNFEKHEELSASFIYSMIEQFGGPQFFYSRYFITALSPIGYTKNEKNFNFYDDIHILKLLEPWIVEQIAAQIKFGCKTDKAFCLGSGKNFVFFLKINAVHHFFDLVIPLEHPRFIMQYRRKKIVTFIDKYINTIGENEIL